MDKLELLTAARAEVEAGWCKNALWDDDGNCCAIGALFRAGAAECDSQLRDVLPAEFNRSIARWNNAPTTTKQDVIAAFSRAINAEAQKVAGNPDPAHVHLQAA